MRTSPGALIKVSSFLPYRFRWVFCQLEVLRFCLPASIRKTLDQLPKSLDDTYLRVLRQIPQANQTHAHRMLQCLVVAVRPLRVEELAELLAFEFDAAQGGIPKYRPALRLDDQTQAVLSTCSSLVTIVNDDLDYDDVLDYDDDWDRDLPHDCCRQLVQFSHFSVKEFLTSNRLAPSLGDISLYHIRLGPAHTTITQACLALLLHLGDDTAEESPEHSPLTDYAAEHWVEHAQFDDVASRVKDGMEKLFDPDRPHFDAWVETYDMDLGVIVWEDLERASPLYYSVLCGFYDLVEYLAVKHPQYVNTFGGKYGFPLLAALDQGHVKVAELLLKHGADVDIREPTGNTILLMAFSWLGRHNNLLDTVEFLLTHGVDVNARNDAFASPLHLAEDYGMQELVTMLLKQKADVNSQDTNGKTPLHRLLGNGIYNDDYDHVRLLLEHGAEVNRQDKDNQTPFLLALKSGWFRTAHILLEHGADPITEKNNGESPWHLLSESWLYDEDEVLDYALLLLKNGVGVNGRHNGNETPLHLAVQMCRFRLARILLEHGADTNARNNMGMTPYNMLLESWSADEGPVLDHTLLLLKQGVRVKRRDKDNQTPLHLDIRRNWFKLAGILLEHGADINAENKSGKTPLHTLLGSQINDEGAILDHALLLLKHGAEVNRRDEDNETPLHLTIQRNPTWSRVAGILLKHGADANAENNQGMTPFHMLLESWPDDEGPILHHVALLKHGVNSEVKNHQTPLHLEIRGNWFRLAGIFLEHGADANTENMSGNTLLHMLLESRINDEGTILDHALLLLKHGAEVNGRNKDSQTPLHLSIRRNWFNLAEILLDHGADANIENNQGMSPFHMLLESHSYDESDLLDHALLLLKHDAEVNRRVGDNVIQTLFLSATERGRFKLACILLDLGADANAINGSGKTPLHILSELEMYDKQDVASGDVLNPTRPLHGAEVNRPRKDDECSLLLPRGMGLYRFACNLLNILTDVDASDPESVESVQVSRSQYDTQGPSAGVSELLLERNVDINAQHEIHWHVKPSSLQENLCTAVRFAQVLLDHGANVNVGNNGRRASLSQGLEGEYYYQCDCLRIIQCLTGAWRRYPRPK